jgi:D-alanyl-D-alanine carboxypeptidase (penicillin-binding protein 5/6)
MTAVLILERHALDEVVEIPASVQRSDGTNAGLQSGGQYTVEDLLAALLIASANDAADVLAAYSSGTAEEFVRAMNVRAKVMGLTDTAFKNPSGLDAAGQFSTPRELAWLTSYALKNPTFRELVKSTTWEIRDRRSGHVTGLANTNRLLKRSPFVKGVKTGTTEEAGECLISLVEWNGREVIVVLLRSSNRYRDSQLVLQELSRVVL